MKTADDRDEPLPPEELRELEREVMGQPDDTERLRQEIRDQLRDVMTDATSVRHENGGSREKTMDARAERYAREHAAIQIASFSC